MGALAAGNLTPTGVGLSRHAWAAIKAEFVAEKGFPPNSPLTGDDVFGVAVTIHPGVGSNFITWRGGLELVE